MRGGCPATHAAARPCVDTCLPNYGGSCGLAPPPTSLLSCALVGYREQRSFPESAPDRLKSPRPGSTMPPNSLHARHAAGMITSPPPDLNWSELEAWLSGIGERLHVNDQAHDFSRECARATSLIGSRRSAGRPTISCLCACAIGCRRFFRRRDESGSRRTLLTMGWNRNRF